MFIYLFHLATKHYFGNMLLKGKVLPYSLLSAGPGAHPSVHAVCPQVTLSHAPVVGCHYFPPGLQSPSFDQYQVILLGDRGT